MVRRQKRLIRACYSSFTNIGDEILASVEQYVATLPELLRWRKSSCGRPFSASALTLDLAAARPVSCHPFRTRFWKSGEYIALRTAGTL